MIIIKIEKKSSYGNDYYYPLNYQKELNTLTGKKTLSLIDIDALKLLGIEFELKRETI